MIGAVDTCLIIVGSLRVKKLFFVKLFILFALIFIIQTSLLASNRKSAPFGIGLQSQFDSYFGLGISDSDISFSPALLLSFNHTFQNNFYLGISTESFIAPWIGMRFLGTVQLGYDFNTKAGILRVFGSTGAGFLEASTSCSAGDCSSYSAKRLYIPFRGGLYYLPRRWFGFGIQGGTHVHIGGEKTTVSGMFGFNFMFYLF